MEKKDLRKDKKETAERLRVIRNERGYTQEKFAEILDVAYPTYKKIERAESGVTVNQLRLMKEKLDISADYLLFGEGNDFDDAWVMVRNLSENDKLRMFLRLHAYLKGHFSVTSKEQEIWEKQGGQIKEILDLFTMDI